MNKEENNKKHSEENYIEDAKKYYEERLRNKLKNEGNNIENIILYNNDQNKITLKKSFSLNPKTKNKNSLNNLLSNNNIYENNVKLTYSIMKDYSQLYINKDDNFLNRMIFDVNKRQSKNERRKKLIEQNKIKINEVQRIKAFNRLIEDANRRIEAQENIENLQGKLSLNLVAPSHKKYNYNQWDYIYKNRFKKFEENSKNKIEKNRKEKEEKNKKIEEEELKQS